MRRPLGCVGSILLLVAILGVVFVVENGGDYLLTAPWAYGWFGQPTLTGSWEGTVRTHSGAQYALYLDLSRYRIRGRPTETFGKADIAGHVNWCSRSIRGATSTLWGHANRSASDLVLETQSLSHLPVGPFPIRFEGGWHGSTLALRVTFYRSLGRGYTTDAFDSTHPVHLTMHKKGYRAFQAACTHV